MQFITSSSAVEQFPLTQYTFLPMVSYYFTDLQVAVTGRSATTKGKEEENWLKVNMDVNNADCKTACILASNTESKHNFCLF